MKQSSNKYWFDKDLDNYLPTFKRFPIALERGQGARLWDVEGNQYLDMLAGIAVNNLGHCHPAVSEAICKQAKRLMHISNFFVSKPQAELSELLLKESGMDRIFFTNSGAESVEGAIKVARKYSHHNNRTGEIVFMHNAFHGRTLATIAAGKKDYQRGFGPIPQGFNAIPFNDLEAASRQISHKTAAVIVEPVQGEGGIIPADLEYLLALREICSRQGALLIFDEIQCGIGRTGKLFAKDHYGVEPDIVTLAKGLGGGMPIGAILCNEKVASAIEPGDHGTTFGGNPLACAASLATLHFILDHQLLPHVETLSKWFFKELNRRKAIYPVINQIRGKGLMIGIVLNEEAKPWVMKMMDRGVIANATAGNVIRLVPPLTITRDELAEFLSVFDQLLSDKINLNEEN
ncbi:MAG: aspartate aminotransferase family protein [Saprospirales bacterium]|nr:MAG: aspartate aminotransferase family protein [Saprospirales bacterium]